MLSDWNFHTGGFLREWFQNKKIDSKQQLSGGKYLVNVRGQRSEYVDCMETLKTILTTGYNQCIRMSL